MQKQQTGDVKLEFAEENLLKKETDFVSTHTQMAHLQDIGKFWLYTIMCFYTKCSLVSFLFWNLRPFSALGISL